MLLKRDFIDDFDIILNAIFKSKKINLKLYL